MTLKITIEMDNAAFENGQGAECAGILRDFADCIDDKNVLDPNYLPAIRDLNGNLVGKAMVTK